MSESENLINDITNSEYAQQIQMEEEQRAAAIKNAAAPPPPTGWKKLGAAMKEMFMSRSPVIMAIIVFGIITVIILGPIGMFDAAWNKYERERIYFKDFVAKNCKASLDSSAIDPEMTELTRRRCHKYAPYVDQGTTRYMLNMFWYTVFEWFWIVLFWCIAHWIVSLLLVLGFCIVCYIFQPYLYFAFSAPLNFLRKKKIKEE